MPRGKGKAVVGGAAVGQGGVAVVFGADHVEEGMSGGEDGEEREGEEGEEGARWSTAHGVGVGDSEVGGRELGMGVRGYGLWGHWMIVSVPFVSSRLLKGG